MEATTKPIAKRRTQAERRAATRGALLDATIECLFEDGYANTTTTRIVERAGVSRGAQVHHFPTKAELVAEAVQHLARRRMVELGERITKIDLRDRGRIEKTLDLMWAQHSTPLFTAALELFVAARTDAELRARMVEVEREVTRTINRAAVDVVPSFGDDAALREWLETALAAMRGLALLNFLDTGVGNRRWPRMRRRLAEAYAAAAAAAS
jgi:AcrR family transcriptional regulator